MWDIYCSKITCFCKHCLLKGCKNVDFTRVSSKSHIAIPTTETAEFQYIRPFHFQPWDTNEDIPQHIGILSVAFVRHNVNNHKKSHIYGRIITYYLRELRWSVYSGVRAGRLENPKERKGCCIAFKMCACIRFRIDRKADYSRGFVFERHIMLCRFSLLCEICDA
jgi:hypothetical protein